MPRPRTNAISFLLSAMAATALCHADDAPYEAYVCVDQADVVAGPGHRYYTTDRLPRGARVEIYREEPSGWLAIRPPEGSFSWAPSEFIERSDEEQIGRVKQSTGSWVGTTVEHVDEHYQQVTLKTGELVHIESEKSVTSKTGTEHKWLKIAPPAGEYRWIHLRDVTRQKPIDPPSMSDENDAAANALEKMSEPRRIEVPGNKVSLRDLRQQ